MTIALVDNGSVEAAAHRNLRTAAAGLAERSGRPVAAVSWRHSDRIPAADLGGRPAWTLGPWVRSQVAAGERNLLFVPFFISAQGAIGSALAADLVKLRHELGHFEFRFTRGLSGAGTEGPAPPSGAPRPLSLIVADRIRQALPRIHPGRPPVVIVDHGGPSPGSAALRDAVAAEVAADLGAEIGALSPASMESPAGPGFGFNQPLLSRQLGAPGYDRGPVVIAPLFLSPGRHAGADGDLARIARASEAAHPGLACHFTGLVGDHPLAVEFLARALAEADGGARSPLDYGALGAAPSTR